MDMQDLKKLADLIAKRNEVEAAIAEIIGCPGGAGNVGEYIASLVFGIKLADSQTNKAYDGRFVDKPLVGKTVNVKFYCRNQRLLDITPNSLPDYYLVLAGPISPASSTRGKTNPWAVAGVYLFEAKSLVGKLEDRQVKIGTATSVAKEYWEDAKIYPKKNPKLYSLTQDQRDALALFHCE